MKKIYTFALATAVSLTAAANINTAKIAADVEEVATDLKVRSAVENTVAGPMKAADYSSVTWKSIGQGKYVASVIADVYGASADPVTVEVYEADGQPGVYKAVGLWPDIVTSGKAEMIIDATNPECVKVPKINTYINDNVDGETYIASRSWVLSEGGYSDATIIAGIPGEVPVLADKLITFPAKSLALNWPNAPEDSEYQTDPTKWYVGKSSGMLILPGGAYVDPWTLIGTGTVSGDMLFKAFGATPSNYEVQVYRSTSNPATIRIVNALKGLYDAIGFTKESPTLDFDTTTPDNVVLPLVSSGINGGATDGYYYICSTSYNFESPESCPADFRITFTEDENSAILSIPVKGMLLYASTAGKLYYLIQDAVTISIKKESGVDAVVAEENAPVEYFNLQGVRVNNPAAGQLLIRRQGAKVEKIFVK